MKVFIIAAEASGDALGASLIEGLKHAIPTILFQGVGGAQMKAAGLPESLFPMEELSLMGIAEIVPQIPKMLKRITETTEAVKAFQPDLLITIDGPDFCFRVQKKVRELNIKGLKQAHCVAPTVWAWREKRAAKIAAFLDGLLCLLPFEPPYFEKEGLKSCYMGHPFVAKAHELPEAEEARALFDLEDNEKTLGLYFGSRGQEVARHLELFCEAVKTLPVDRFLVPTLPHLHDRIADGLARHGLTARTQIVLDKAQHGAAMRASHAALAVSGTIGLELALAGTPHIIAYKMSPLTYHVVKHLIKVGNAHLGSLIFGRTIVPEYIQGAATPLALSEGLMPLLTSADAIVQQKRDFVLLIEALTTKKPPSDLAADFLLGL
ncbi:MAG: lipid-A-disaccharide synthase [Pseudobdellovibrionaceae bacterium]